VVGDRRQAVDAVERQARQPQDLAVEQRPRLARRRLIAVGDPALRRAERPHLVGRQRLERDDAAGIVAVPFGAQDVTAANAPKSDTAAPEAPTP
jgi:hypothetical protein